jgi:hypothetical protein
MRGGAVVGCRDRLSLACHKVTALDAGELGKRARPTIARRGFIDAANRAGPNPQVIEKDLVLGCLIAERPMNPAHPVTNTVLPSNFMVNRGGYAENELNTDIRYSP